MEYFCFELKTLVSVEQMWDRLSEDGFQLLYANEDPNGQKQIYGYLPSKFCSSQLKVEYPEIKDFYLVQFNSINWHDQWGALNETFIDIDLKKYSTQKALKFKMRPGPGFGDLSHPTTQLALRLMAPQISGKFVIDLGCGSGVLSFAAAKLGAQSVCGIDIDENALMHARDNLEHNAELKGQVHFQSPKEPLQVPKNVPVLLVMNMIYQEQETAWKSLPQLHTLPMICITTGILREKKQQKLYEAMCKDWGWAQLECLHEGKWCGYVSQFSP
jgi:ribosomal protein L11 methyltransferase